MTIFSPAAQAVWNAFLDRYEWTVTTEELFAVAAVLRAAADQVVPEGGSRRNNEIRSEFLSIAEELEAQ